MVRRFERHGLGLLFTFFLILGGLQDIASGQVNKVSLPTAVKEAQQAGVSTVTVNQLLSSGYENHVESSVMAGYIQFLTDIQREKLPLEPFVNKIEEGMTKRVSSQGIHHALMKKREDYRFTQSTIKETLRKHNKEHTIPNEDLVRCRRHSRVESQEKISTSTWTAASHRLLINPWPSPWTVWLH